MASTAQELEFTPPDVDAVVGAMRALNDDQRGWITLRPGIHPDDEPPPRTLFGAIFSGNGPPVPVCTWVAPEAKQKPPHPEIGILHQSGPKAERRLREHGVLVPERWVVLSDHPRRGIVVAVHPDAPHEEVLAWLLRAAGALSRIPLVGTWKASIHAGS